MSGVSTRTVVPGELFVNIDEIRIGDLAVASNNGSSGWGDRGRLNTWTFEMEIIDLPEPNQFGGWIAKVKYTKPSGEVIKSSISIGKLGIWIRPREAKRDAGKFPHSCDYCGKPAYVGAYRVEHAVPGNCGAA